MRRTKLVNTEQRQNDVILYVYLSKEVRLYDTSMDVYGWLHKRGTLAGATPQTELIFVHLAAQGLDSTLGLLMRNCKLEEILYLCVYRILEYLYLLFCC